MSKIIDVAERAGVSISTVSNVLNKTKYVSPELVARVERAVEERLRGVRAPIKVAVMGCVVNGPGESREADLGVAGGKDMGVIFRKGKVVRSVKGQGNLLPAFMEELQQLLDEEGNR